ncbi:hypothetical protein FIBSPDRAFT_866443 [Athelia psychrophila]|uniref:Uncharacterized protein n=1 Tax=Athelia psychrophila TaxID=1759441 RepID=A0A166EPS5_9AGAM|nr:hypothetical protein FIBSPDRAFT_866443 [Fibularhizoctonia sp. CBS 109695]
MRHNVSWFLRAATSDALLKSLNVRRSADSAELGGGLARLSSFYFSFLWCPKWKAPAV